MDLKQFRNYLLGEGFNIATIQGKLRYLKRVDLDLDMVRTGEMDKYKIAEWLYNQEDLGDEAKNNFAKAINSYLGFIGIHYRLKLKYPEGEKDVWIPTKDEAKRLMSVDMGDPFKTKRIQLILKLFLIGGLRRNEVRKLKYSDFNETPDKEAPSIRYHYINVLGKGNKWRLVNIPPSLYSEVMEYKRTYGYGEFLFNNRRGKPISHNHVGRIAKDAAIRAGVPQFHPHAGRHYRTVELDDQEIGIESIRRFLGHSKLTTTQGYLRGRRHKTRDEFVSKDHYFAGLRDKKKSDEPAPQEAKP